MLVFQLPSPDEGLVLASLGLKCAVPYTVKYHCHKYMGSCSKYILGIFDILSRYFLFICILLKRLKALAAL